jgi:hypothetical protein
MDNQANSYDPTLERLLGPTGHQIGCDECFDLLDQYVELEVRGLGADERIPGMRAHLDGCPACHEEHESLHALVSGDARGGRHS